MNKSGHKGISILFSAPLVAILLALDLVVLALLYSVITIGLSSLPDADIHLQKQSSVKLFNVKLRQFQLFNIPITLLPHMILVRFALMLRNIQMRLVGKKAVVPHSEFTVSHRGITHTVWYMAVVGGFFGVVGFSVLYGLSIGLPYEYAELLFIDILNASVYLTSAVLFIAGFSSVLFHCIGDVFTPTGINFMSLNTQWGVSLRNLKFTVFGKEISPEFYYDNKVANRSASVFGVIGFSYAIFFGLYFGQLNSLYLFLGFIVLFTFGIPLWLLVVKTRIGEWIYKVYDVIF